MTVEGDRSAPSAIYPYTLYEALQKVTEIEILIRRISEETGTGRHRSLFAGTGADFQEIREYHFGDDIRAIDWNCTARFYEPYIRVFQEEHDMAIYLVVDRSASGTFGTDRSKDETIFEIAVSIIISAQIFGDRIGVCLFTDGVEVFIPPGRGRQHTAVLLDTLMRYKPACLKTDLGKTLSQIFSKIQKRSLVILLSDFDSGDFEDEILLLRHRHEVRAIRIKDRSEDEIPDVGHLLIRDPETGEELIIDTSDQEFRTNFRKITAAKEEALHATFTSAGIRCLEIRTDEDYAAALKNYFRLGWRAAE